MTLKIAIVANNVKSSGGLRLLYDLVESSNDNIDSTLFVANEFNFEQQGNFEIFRSKYGVFFLCFIFLKLHWKKWDKLISLGNFPVPFYKKRQYLFIQNMLLLSNKYDCKLPYSSRLLTKIKRLLFILSIKSCGSYLNIIVQTPSMHRGVIALFGEETQVSIIPFVNNKESLSVANCNLKPVHDYFYPAAGQPHKNHLNLLSAWELLGEQGYFPSLLLTIDECQFPLLSKKIEFLKNNCNLKILNVGFVNEGKVRDLFFESKNIIFPSFAESFGLPLVDAVTYKKPIIASELDYVRDVCKPEFSFDPNSPISIARAVMRHSCLHEKEGKSVTNGDVFWSKIYDDCF